MSWDFIFKFRKKDNKNTYKNTTLYSAQFVDYLVWCLYEWCSGHGMPWQPLATQVEKEIRNTKYKMWVEKVKKKKKKEKLTIIYIYTNWYNRSRICFWPSLVVLSQYHHLDGRTTFTYLAFSSLLSSPVISLISSAVYTIFEREIPSFWNTSQISFDFETNDSTNRAMCFRPSSPSFTFLL